MSEDKEECQCDKCKKKCKDCKDTEKKESNSESRRMNLND